MSRASPTDAPEESDVRRRPRYFLRRLAALVALFLLATLAVLLVLWLTGAFGQSQTASSAYEDSISAGNEPEVTVNNERGSLRITGEEDLDQVELQARIHASANDAETAERNASDASVDLARDGSEVTVGGLSGDAAGANYELRVPADSRVTVDSGSGGVEIENVAALEAELESGDVNATGIRGPVSVQAPNGDVNLTGVSAPEGDLTAEVGAGDLALEDIETDRLEAEAETGGASVTGPFSGAGELYVETGDIVVDAPEEAVEELDLRTGVGSVIREEDEDSGEG